MWQKLCRQELRLGNIYCFTCYVFTNSSFLDVFSTYRMLRWEEEHSGKYDRTHYNMGTHLYPKLKRPVVFECKVQCVPTAASGKQSHSQFTGQFDKENCPQHFTDNYLLIYFPLFFCNTLKHTILGMFWNILSNDMRWKI